MDIFALYSPILFPCSTAQHPASIPFVIICKCCQQNIPGLVQTLPDSWIVAECPLCGEKRRYLPADTFRGRLSHDLLMKPPRISDRR